MPNLSQHMLAMEAIQAALQSLTLTGLSSSNIVIREYVTDKGLTVPMIQIAPYGQETIEPGTNRRDDIGYPCLVAIIAKGETTNPSHDQRLLWREQIIADLHNTKPGSIANNYEFKVTPYNVCELGALLNSKTWVSSVLVRAFFRRPRT